MSAFAASAAPPPTPPADAPFGAPAPAPVPAVDPVDGLPLLPAVPAAPLRSALDQVGLAIAQVGGELRAVAPRPIKGGDFLFSSGRAGRTLIIQSSDPDPKTYANLEEDLNVMYQILSKTRKRDDGSGFQTRLEDITFRASGSSSVRSMYIEGYGAVFMLGVRFPLVAPQSAEEQPKPKDTTSEEWERAKKELNSRGTFELNLDRIVGGAMASEGEEYDAQKVDDLTVGILEALKNGTHIRNLKSDEFITVAVLGAPSGAVRSVVEKDDEDGKGGKKKMRIENVRSGSGIGESTMTIRAKRSDIDDFAKGKQTLDAFRKKAKILVYLRPLDASGKTSVFVPPSPARP